MRGKSEKCRVCRATSANVQGGRGADTSAPPQHSRLTSLLLFYVYSCRASSLSFSSLVVLEARERGPIYNVELPWDSGTSPWCKGIFSLQVVFSCHLSYGGGRLAPNSHAKASSLCLLACGWRGLRTVAGLVRPNYFLFSYNPMLPLLTLIIDHF